MFWGLVLGFEHPVNRIEMNHTFNIPWHQFKTQVIKLQVKRWITVLDTTQPTATATRSKTINNNHISIIIYIARSTGLSPTEHQVWDVLGRGMWANHPPPFGLNQVFRTVAAGVASDPQGDSEEVGHVREERCLDCIHANGGHTCFWLF